MVIPTIRIFHTKNLRKISKYVRAFAGRSLHSLGKDVGVKVGYPWLKVGHPLTKGSQPF